MLKRDEVANPNSCLNKAADDEPIFVLRANDPCAPTVVRRWANSYLIGKSEGGRTLTPDQLAKATEAYRLASEMELWKENEVFTAHAHQKPMGRTL